jgi:predicted nucleic acid-binding protein
MMVLVDTSVWVEHLRRGLPELSALLEEEQVLGHPFVTGELACGNLRSRAILLENLKRLPQSPHVSHEEANAFLENGRLFGLGLGWIDVHLLASARLAACRLWTLDKPLRAAAAKLGLNEGALNEL